MNTFHIYAIVRRETQDAYVGLTHRLKRRWQEHKWALELGRHTSIRLQDAWNQHGEAAFDFTVLWTLIDISFLNAKRAELYWIDKIGAYNDLMADMANGKLFMREDERVVIAERNRKRGRTPEQRANMGEHTKRRWADPEQREALMNAPTRGKHHIKGMAPVNTPEQSAAHSAHMRAIWADPEKRTKLEARRAVRWSDPEAKARQAEKMRAYHAARRAAKNAAD